MHTHRITLALFAAFSAPAALLIAQPAAVAQARFDPYTQGAVDKADLFAQGANRQTDTCDYLSWKHSRFDPYAQDAGRQASARDVLARRSDTSYPGGTDGSHA